jgi:hypothetical protein
MKKASEMEHFLRTFTSLEASRLLNMGTFLHYANREPRKLLFFSSLNIFFGGGLRVEC